MLEIKGLVKRYGAKAAVDHLDLTCENGEIFGFIGPNGAKQRQSNRSSGFWTLTRAKFGSTGIRSVRNR